MNSRWLVLVFPLFVSCQDVNKLCEGIVKCDIGLDQQECVDELSIYEFSNQCYFEHLEKATCEEHRDMSYWDACWPRSCDPETFEQFCKGDSITACDDRGRQVTINCERLCYANKKNYLVSCNKISPTGKPSKTGKQVCWCEGEDD